MRPHPRQLSETELIEELKRIGAMFKGKAMHCIHPENHQNGDRNPSASVYCGKDGVWRWTCQVCGKGGDVFDVQSLRTGKPLAEILKEHTQDPNVQQRAAQRPSRAYASLEDIYTDMTRQFGGHLEALHPYPDNFQMIRWRVSPDKKEMRPVVKTAAGYAMVFPEGKRPLYRRNELTQIKTVLVMEGEGKADLMTALGFPATTSSGGCKAAGKTDWGTLAGKNIIIWPDHDQAGAGYLADVRRILEGLGCIVKTIDPTDLDLQTGEDAADYIAQLRAAGYDDLRIKENLLSVFAKAKSTGPAAELDGYFHDVIDGRIQTVPTGFKTLDRFIQLVPETVNGICGSPGVSKSLWMLQLLAFWIEQGIRAACFMLERGKPFHLARALAQRAGIANLTRLEWIKKNPDLVLEAMKEHRDFIDRLGRCITVEPNKSISQDDVLAWAKQRSETGHKVLIIDPITLRARSGNAWDADEDLIRGLKAIAAEYKTIILCVLHPAKGMILTPDLSSLSGGAIISRATDTVVWLEHHGEPKQSSVAIADGYSVTEEVTHNRSIIILKSRDGSGKGAKIACDLSSESLLLKEIGLILKKTSKTGD